MFKFLERKRRLAVQQQRHNAIKIKIEQKKKIAYDIIMKYENSPLTDMVLGETRKYSEIKKIEISIYGISIWGDNEVSTLYYDQIEFESFKTPEKWEAQNKLSDMYLFACALYEKLGKIHDIVEKYNYSDRVPSYKVWLEKPQEIKSHY